MNGLSRIQLSTKICELLSTTKNTEFTIVCYFGGFDGFAAHTFGQQIHFGTVTTVTELGLVHSLKWISFIFSFSFEDTNLFLLHYQILILPEEHIWGHP